MMNIAVPNYDAHWSLYPRSYTAQRIEEPIVVDGNIEKPQWLAVPFSEAFGDIASGELAAGTTQFKALYDDKFLYVAALLHPAPNLPTEAHFVERNSPIFQLDSDFEVFFDIDQSHHHYKELEINALGTVWNLMLDKPYNDGGVEHSARIAQPGDPRYYEVFHQHSGTRVVSGRLNNDENEGAVWSTELALAWDDLRANTTATATPPAEARINFSRVEKQGDINWTWQRQVQWNPEAKKFTGEVNMHMPDSWGYIVMGTAPTAMKDEHRDPYWPARLTVVTVYYALHHYKDMNGRYTADVDDLVLPPDIISPFEVTIATTDADQKYVATVTSRLDATAATIQNDRRVQVIQKHSSDLFAS